MAKVFTITQGLDNMGPMKTGGQGSVYRGRRIGEIITAVKLLPTPIYGEENDDKNFRDFKNEVEKLKRVNEKPNPNVIKILSSGLSETGNFPFIEMEYIEGPDLEELLQPPNAPVFTIKEVIKVSEQLSNALAHCHSLGVKHGDIKSNNVKLNIHTGNYVLLDFGLAIMSDEQRRTSLRQAGAVEFMAPEQNEGQMLFQTDVYSFGIVLFELLAGTVPFPLKDKGETARNNVRLAHMESLPPDVVALRKAALPETWPQDKRGAEINVPGWLTTVIYKCLNKKPGNRFANGMDLYNFIIQNSVHVLPTIDVAQQAALLAAEKEHLKKKVAQYRDDLLAKEREYEALQGQAKQRDERSQLLEVKTNSISENRVAKSSFIAALFFVIALAAFAGYSYFKNGQQDNQQLADTKKQEVTGNKTIATSTKKTPKKRSTSSKKKAVKDTQTTAKALKKTVAKSQEKPVADTAKSVVTPSTVKKSNKGPVKYTVVSKAYFHTTPDPASRREAYITQWNNAILTPQDDMHGFVYIVYTNDKGQTSRGWIRKEDLKPVDQ